MIKNIILDIGGVLFDDSNKNLSNIMNKDEVEIKDIAKIAFGGTFKKCLVGEMTVEVHLDNIRKMEIDNKLKEDAMYVVDPKFYNETFPMIKETYEYIKVLKANGFKIYLLSNITEAAFRYINEIIDLDTFVDGGIYSYMVNTRKPNKDIYELLIKKYNLNKEECIFFDDKEINVESANEYGINSYIFKSIEDIKLKVK